MYTFLMIPAFAPKAHDEIYDHMFEIKEKNNVSISGTGDQVIIFAHGFGCDQGMWRFVAPAFVDDYKVILFDYTGSGQSIITEYDPKKYSVLEGYAEDIVDICQAFEIKDAIIVGHSVSATIALLASLTAPEHFSQLIHLTPSPYFINDQPKYMGGFEYTDIEELLDLMDKSYIGWAEYLAPLVIGGQASELLTGELADSFCSTEPLIAKNFAKATFLSDHRDSYSKSNLPSLIIHSKVDSLVSIEVGKYLHNITPNSDFKIIDSVGHCPHMTHPGITVQAIKDYLRNG
jgi:sigma-B regulation protein RsbQ